MKRLALISVRSSSLRCALKLRLTSWILVGTFVVGVREMHHIVCIVFDRKDPDSRRRAHWLLTTLIDDAAKRGWGEYRTHLSVMDQIAKTYSFNGGAQMKLNEKIKEALDP